MQRNKNTERRPDANEYDVAKIKITGRRMSGILAEMSVIAMVAAILVVSLAGYVKGVVGFAMPLILISGLGSFLPAEIAIAALILPTVATNFTQAFRTGFADAWASFRRFWRFNLIVFVTIILSAQMVRGVPQHVLFLLLGGMVTFFTVLQLAGWRPRIYKGFATAIEVVTAVIAGFFGGMSGVWGPPTILYLTAIDIPKAESVRVQGIMYLAGSVLLLVAHLKSGVLNSATFPLSMLLVLPALLMQWVGLKTQDRLDQALFRRITLVVLALAGLNLLRRGLLG